MSTTEYVDDVKSFLQENIILQCVQVAVCSLLVYDTMLTMDKEIEYFWTRRWYRLTHILFFVNRYIGILGAISSLSLEGLGATDKLLYLIMGDLYIKVSLIETADTIILRVLALWNKNKLFSITLYSLIICEAVAKFVLVGIGSTVKQVRAYPLTGELVFCGEESNQLEHSSYFQFSDWVITAAIGFILLSLALFKTIEHWRSMGLKGSNLVNMMIKDQMIYYLILIICSAINTASTRNRSLESSSIQKAAILNTLGDPGLLCLVGSRMFLNLKEAGDVQVNEGTGIPSNNFPTDTISVLHFAAPAISSPDSEIQTDHQASHPSILG